MTTVLPDELHQWFGNRCLTAAERRFPYEHPERGAAGHASAVLLPESKDEIQRLLRLANERGLGLVLCAGRTGLVEAQRPEGELLLSLERLKRPLHLHLADGRRFDFAPAQSLDQARDALFSWWTQLGRPDLSGSTVTAEAGLAVDALNELLAPLGRMFPMEMGSSASASVGGCSANASAGANAVCYGTAAHMTASARGFWGDASAAGPCSSSAWRRPSPDQLAIDSTALPEDWGLIGSQGIFGLITELTLQTQPVPLVREAVLLAVSDMQQAMKIFEQACAEFGQDIEEFEFLSRSAVSLVLRRMGSGVRLPFEKDPELPYLILMQIKSNTEDEALPARLYEFCASSAGLADEHIGYGPLQVLKKIRHSVTESSNLEMRALGGGRLTFDTATPVAVFGQYLDQLARAIRDLRPDVQLIDFGHAGVGGAHLHLIGSTAKSVNDDAEQLTNLVFDVTEKFAGTFSAEHGVGPKWAKQFLKRSSKADLQALVARKCRFDPANVLSPRSFGLDQLMRKSDQPAAL